MGQPMDLKSARKRFDDLIEQSKTAYGTGKYLECAVLLQRAAYSAWHRHPGLFHSTEMETLLRSLSARVIKSAAPKIDTGGACERVLHVLTQAYDIGGHTRLAARWIEADTDRQHHIVLTQQGIASVPRYLKDLTRKSASNLFVLDQRKNLFELAGTLREIASSFNFIVLHVHPHDVIPHLAWSGATDHPPIAYLNHADHVFWIGGLICDTNINIRESGRRLAVGRRGIPAPRNVLLPIPLLDRPRKRMSRQQAKNKLSIASDDYVALTIAAEHKFSPINDMDFVRIHVPLLQRFNRLNLLVVGPSDTAPYWKHWSAATNGRVKAVGVQANTETFLDAADIYIDSTPLGSLTSLLEAGLASLPCVSWRPYLPISEEAVLACDDIALNGFSVAINDHSQYLQQIDYLINNPDNASVIGQELRKSIVETHISGNWLKQLDAVYENLRNQVKKRPHSDLLENVGAPGVFDHILLRTQEVTKAHRPGNIYQIRMRLRKSLSKRHARLQKSLNKRYARLQKSLHKRLLRLMILLQHDTSSVRAARAGFSAFGLGHTSVTVGRVAR